LRQNHGLAARATEDTAVILNTLSGKHCATGG
jgi:hypothetical protein